MKIARETDYAIRCLLQMAQRPGGRHTVRTLSALRGIPSTFLAKILQKLGKAGIVSSARGSGGGFRLARLPGDITVLSMIEAVEGPLAPNACIVERNRCSQADRCAVHPLWRECRELLAEKLGKVTLQHLAEREDAMEPEGIDIAEVGP